MGYCSYLVKDQGMGLKTKGAGERGHIASSDEGLVFGSLGGLLADHDCVGVSDL
jgi:hypothetical protein